MYASEWDYRAPTLAEQVDDLKANWHGPRCPHGMPLNAPGPDLICNSCEAEMAAEDAMADLRDDLDRGGRYPFPIGPYLDAEGLDILLGLRDRPKGKCVNCHQPIHGFVHLTGEIDCADEDILARGMYPDEGWRAWPTPPTSNDLPF